MVALILNRESHNSFGTVADIWPFFQNGVFGVGKCIDYPATWFRDLSNTSIIACSVCYFCRKYWEFINMIRPDNGIILHDQFITII